MTAPMVVVVAFDLPNDVDADPNAVHRQLHDLLAGLNALPGATARGAWVGLDDHAARVLTALPEDAFPPEGTP